jgi:hypothetical protein
MYIYSVYIIVLHCLFLCSVFVLCLLSLGSCVCVCVCVCVRVCVCERERERERDGFFLRTGNSVSGCSYVIPNYF